jgi:DNA-binding GntR family transcriptional regulator
VIDMDIQTSAASSRKERSTSLSNEIYRSIRNEIVKCELDPGAKLQIDRLADRYGVSLSAVREALSRLSADGLVVAQPQRGFWVAPVALDDLRDITRARVEIESICVRWSVENGNAEWERRLSDSHERLRSIDPIDIDTHAVTNEWETEHNEFHEALTANCGNAALTMVRRQLFERAERYRCLAGKLMQHGRGVAQEHALILQAARRRDGVLTAALIASHIRATSENLLEHKLNFTASEGTA